MTAETKRRRPAGLVIIVLGAALAALAVVAAWLETSRAREVQLLQAQSGLLDDLRGFEMLVASELRGIDAMLVELRRRAEAAPAGAPSLPATTMEALRLAGLDGGVVHVALIGPDGQVVAAIGEVGLSPAALRASTSWRALAAGSTGLDVAQPYLDVATGRWIIALARRIDDPAGRFAGIVQIGVDAAHFSRLHEAVALPARGRLSLAGRDGVVRLALGGAPEIGERVALPADAFAARQGATGAEADDAGQLVAWRVLADHPLLVTISQPLDQALAASEARAQQVRAAGVVVAGLVLALTVWLARDQRRLARRDAVMSRVIEFVPDGMQLLDRKLRMISCNDRFFEMLRLDRAAILAAPDPVEAVWRTLAARGDYGPGAVEDLVAERRRALLAPADQPLRREMPGIGRWIEVRRTALPDGGFLSIYRDVTDQVDRERRLETLADTDGLTGLLNRRAFERDAEIELGRARRRSAPIAAFLLDIDHFKKVNDTHGHAAGDDVLRRVGRALTERLRRSDVIGRIGGEELAAVLPETDIESARQVAEALRLAIAGLGFVGPDGRLFSVTVSIGVADLGEAGALTTGLQQADAALYAAKRGGRDRVIVAPRGGGPPVAPAA